MTHRIVGVLLTALVVASAACGKYGEPVRRQPEAEAVPEAAAEPSAATEAAEEEQEEEEQP